MILNDVDHTGYPADEAASRGGMKMRLTEAPEFFYAGYTKDTNELVGYICSTMLNGDEYTDTSFEEHVPTGDLCCVHSVCVDPRYRRRGIATDMLKKYIQKIHAMGRVRMMVLICKKHTQQLYANCGFRLVGPSSVVHGAELWYEMRREP
eukprot:TRINITY_DN2085_c0_g1_i2.p1 TRINITY_DN2085_c0_g1~~TRINITY_DN2085_c0_g1_i2.p1  ORF type:complete len:150 (+),score=23.12 TRINITY_DN2085_c0_g1_i2:350-799(+)